MGGFEAAEFLIPKILSHGMSSPNGNFSVIRLTRVVWRTKRGVKELGIAAEGRPRGGPGVAL